MTPEKQDGPYKIGSSIMAPGYSVKLLTQMDASRANLAYAQGAASRDAEVAQLKAFTSQQTKGTLALIEDNGKLEAENKALKTEVERLRGEIVALVALQET